ncbi:MAG TPA: hypothetical protein VGH71_00795, partial [Gammaproteobacteria bacterium]
MNDTQELTPATARKIAVWQMAFFAALLCVIALSNTFTTLADNARGGMILPGWKPAAWEFSSVSVVWCLVFAVEWCLKRFPLTAAGWWRN